MAEADLSPTTFTSRSASDPDYDISTEDSSENENEIHTLKLPVIIHHQTQKQKAMQRPEVRRSSTMPKTEPKSI